MKVCLISSSGGHLEQLMQLKQTIEKYDCFLVTTNEKSSKNINMRKYFINDLSRKDISKIKYIFLLVRHMIGTRSIINYEQPDIIITTGAGAAIPLCLMAKLMRKKLVYIESFARIDTPNATGKFLYHFADAFIIQWPELKKYYPKAIYGGWIY